MSIPEQSGDSFDFCVLFRVYFTGKGAICIALFMQLYKYELTQQIFKIYWVSFEIMTIRIQGDIIW